MTGKVTFSELLHYSLKKLIPEEKKEVRIRVMKDEDCKGIAAIFYWPTWHRHIINFAADSPAFQEFFPNIGDASDPGPYSYELQRATSDLFVAGTYRQMFPFDGYIYVRRSNNTDEYLEAKEREFFQIEGLKDLADKFVQHLEELVEN